MSSSVVPVDETGLTPEQIKEIRDTFKLFDKDGDGHISGEEVATVIRSVGFNLSDDEIKNIVDRCMKWDKDNNGRLEYDEFMELMKKELYRMPKHETDLREAFRMFDKNGDGHLSAEELREVLTSMGEKLAENEVEDMIAEADTDGDGQVNYEEFVTVMTRTLES